MDEADKQLLFILSTHHPEYYLPPLMSVSIFIKLRGSNSVIKAHNELYILFFNLFICIYDIKL